MLVAIAAAASASAWIGARGLFAEESKLNDLPTAVDTFLLESVVILFRHLANAIRGAIELIMHSKRSLGCGLCWFSVLAV